MNSPSDMLAHLCGEELSDFLLLEGGTLALFFGRVLSKEPLTTWWELWVECPWRAESGSNIIIGSIDDAELVCSKLSGLKGRLVASARPNGSTNDIAIAFDSDVVIATFSDSVVGHAWELKRRDGYRLGCGPDNKLHERTLAPEEVDALAQVDKHFRGGQSHASPIDNQQQ